MMGNVQLNICGVGDDMEGEALALMNMLRQGSRTDNGDSAPDALPPAANVDSAPARGDADAEAGEGRGEENQKDGE